MTKKDELEILIDALKKREEVLEKYLSVSKYNKYFDIMRKSARKLIDENRQEELLPYLHCGSISIQRDVAGLLFHCYPEECTEVLKKISDMSVQTGLPKHLSCVSASADMALKIGVPENYP